MSGANYFISTRQVLESDRKIRALSLLKFSDYSLDELDDTIRSTVSHSAGQKKLEEHVANEISAVLTFNQLPTASDANIIYYISGYIARSVCRITKCEFCGEALNSDPNDCLEAMEVVDGNLPYKANSFLDTINRGGLKNRLSSRTL